MLLIYLLLLSVISLPLKALNDELAKKLKKGLSAAEVAIASISKEWSVEKYPNFLKSCFMHKVSWEMMKLRFQKKIVQAAHAYPHVGSQYGAKFVVSFLGSSVTAGHDSLFNASTPVQTGLIMQPVLAKLDVELDSRNVALGNNPCTPYDVCVKYFAGLDADVVHWEQSYFCEGRAIMEQFVRQASFMPSRPIVVFSESQTGTWPTDDCKKNPPPHKLTTKEMELLHAQPVRLVTEINKDEFHRAWNFLADYTHLYHGAGIQTFTHLKHEAYKCQGPYISSWGEGAASWHPSVLGHRLRASHHSYFWLLIWIDAIKDLQSMVSHRQLDAIQKDIDLHIDKLHEPVNPPKYPHVPFPDRARCFTDYEPRMVREASLRSLAIQGVAAGQGDERVREEEEREEKKGGSKRVTSNGWNYTIYEDIVDKELVERSRERGYLDYKWMLYGDKDSGPLSFNITLKTASPIFICETPGIWGSLPKGFDHLWKPVVDVYMTYRVPDLSKFEFSPSTATKYSFHYNQDLEICTQVWASSKQPKAPAGVHVLTLVPKSKTKAIVAWIITA